MTVTVVLDTTAVLAYTKGSIAMGELLSIITDDGDSALIPATCLAEAHRRVTGDVGALASILQAIPSVEMSPLLASQAAEVGAAARGRASIDASHAALEAVAREAQLVTQDVAIMSSLLPPDWPIVEI